MEDKKLLASYLIYLYCMTEALRHMVIAILLPLVGTTRSHVHRKIWKSSILFGFHPPVLPPVRLHLNINVLLHELYPTKEASATSPTDREDQLSPQGARCRPGPSNPPISSVPALNTGANRASPILPLFSSFPADSTWLESGIKVPSDVTSGGTVGNTYESPQPTLDEVDVKPIKLEQDAESTDCMGVSHVTEHAVNNGAVVSEGPVLDVSHDALLERDCDRENIDCTPHIFECHTVKSRGPSIKQEDLNIKRNVEQRIGAVLSAGHGGVQSNVLSTINSNDRASELRSWNCQPSTSHTSTPNPSALAAQTHASRRKASLKPVQPLSRSASLSSGSDWDFASFTMGGSSSDSELDCRSNNSSWLDPERDLRRVKHRGHHSGLSVSLASTHSSDGSLFPNAMRSTCSSLHERPSPRKSNTTISDHGAHYGYSHDLFSASSRADRHLRDVTALEHAQVPFTYEEIVFASNEYFRELRSAPNLTEEQINAMLDARKRATNRQAAERCRRQKTATRDDFREQLAAIRLKHQVLQRQIGQARQRKQRISDCLIAEEKRILSLLRGPDGSQLKYSDWRVRLDKDDEVVLVAVGN